MLSDFPLSFSVDSFSEDLFSEDSFLLSVFFSEEDSLEEDSVLLSFSTVSARMVIGEEIAIAMAVIIAAVW